MSMKFVFSTFILLGGATAGSAYEFEPPVRLESAGKAVRVESPGYAAPCWADLDGDGKQDLLVGQFRDGRIQVYRNEGDGLRAAGSWLEAEGNVAHIPGVW
jgi:hypothetical protein